MESPSRIQSRELTNGLSSIAAPWQVEDAPDSFIAAQIKGIIGLEIPLARLDGKWKVSQNRPAIDQVGVASGLRGLGADANAMADEVVARGKPARATN